MFNQNNDLYTPYQAVSSSSIMRQVYIWMTLGMLATAASAALTISNPTLKEWAMNPLILIVALFAEIGLVFGIGMLINRISASTAAILFFIYAALNGFTLSLVLLAYGSGNVVPAFVATAGLFAAMSIIGTTTSLDLSKFGTILMVGVIGLFIAMLVNVFLGSSTLDFIISIAGVLIFTALTAYDTQRINQMATSVQGDSNAAAKVGVMGALRLYLDFINLFLFLLRLFGRDR